MKLHSNYYYTQTIKDHLSFLKYKTDTELSNEVWRMEKSVQTPVITWKIVQKCFPYNPNSKRCYLCLNKKLEIATYRGDTLLNKKAELISKCRRRNKQNKYIRFPSMTQRTDVSCIVRNHNFPFVNHFWLRIVG